MVLNKECVRDILLLCEKSLKLDDNGEMNSLSSQELSVSLPKYKLAEIKYTVLKLEEAGLINAIIISPDGFLVMDFRLYDISYDGHEFIESIRNDDNWGKVKSLASKVGSYSISTLQQIAVSVISYEINSLMTRGL